MTKRIIILASGSGSLAEAIMDAHIEDLEIVAVISDRPAAVLAKAQRRRVRAELVSYSDYSSRASWDDRMIEIASQCKPDLVVSVGFMRILSPDFVRQFPTINTHPALLPLFPGAHAVRDALAAGVSESGSTVHWVDEGVDTGRIISQRVVKIQSGDTEESLHERIKIVERVLIVETLRVYVESGLPA